MTKTTKTILTTFACALIIAATMAIGNIMMSDPEPTTNTYAPQQKLF
jgi:hypothetical protein